MYLKYFPRLLSYLTASHTLFRLIALGLWHCCYSFMPFQFPYLCFCIRYFNLVYIRIQAELQQPKLAWKIPLFSFYKQLFSLLRLQVIVSKSFRIVLVFCWLEFISASMQTFENVSLNTMMSLNMNLSKLVFTSLLHLPRGAHVPLV